MTDRVALIGDVAGRWPVLFMGAATLLFAAGCLCCPFKETEPVGMVEPVSAEPSLPAATDPHLTLFGELPERSRVPFTDRAVSPMKQHTFTTEGADFDVDVSPDGEWIVFASTRHTARPNLYLKRVDGRAVTQLTDEPAGDVHPVFSPDGRHIAFASRRSGSWDLWMVTLEGGQPTQLTHSPRPELYPSWSPDGRRLVYCVFNDRAGQWEIWTLHLGHPGSRRMIGVGLFPRWSPVTDSIVYQKARERGGRWFSIWRVDLDLGEPQFPVEVAVSAEMALIRPAWSPDGQWISYGTAYPAEYRERPDEVGVMLARGGIWVIGRDGASPRRLTDEQGIHFGPAWGSDGRVYFTSNQGGSENIWSVQAIPGRGRTPTGRGTGEPDRDRLAEVHDASAFR